jgi:pyrroline-5-carboxylate reductase
MLLETGKHPAELKDMVTSPGGTTIAALSVLERQAFRGAIIEAISAAHQRAKELAKSSSE